MKSKIILKVNELEYLKILTPRPIKDLFRYDEVTIKFYSAAKQEYTIFSNDFIIYALRLMIGSIDEALNGKLKLHKSIKEDIGFMCNEYYADRNLDKIKYKINEGRKFWVGLKYGLLCGKGCKSWFYEKNNKLILEITPIYSWPNFKRKKSDYIDYDKFIKNYKPYVITQVDKDKAIKWLKKAQRILKIVESNDSKYFD